MTFFVAAMIPFLVSHWSNQKGSRRVRPRRTYQRPGMLAGTGERRSHIVVVDDDAAIADIVCAVLRDAHINAEACTSARDAYAQIQSSQPDAVILDVQMPYVDGIQVFEQLQNDPSTQSIPVIFLSANAESLTPHLPEFNALGVRLLRKPFNDDELLAIVGTVLRMR